MRAVVSLLALSPLFLFAFSAHAGCLIIDGVQTSAVTDALGQVVCQGASFVSATPAEGTTTVPAATSTPDPIPCQGMNVTWGSYCSGYVGTTSPGSTVVIPAPEPYFGSLTLTCDNDGIFIWVLAQCAEVWGKW